MKAQSVRWLVVAFALGALVAVACSSTTTPTSPIGAAVVSAAAEQSGITVDGLGRITAPGAILGDGVFAAHMLGATNLDGRLTVNPLRGDGYRPVCAAPWGEIVVCP